MSRLNQKQCNNKMAGKQNDLKISENKCVEDVKRRRKVEKNKKM